MLLLHEMTEVALEPVLIHPYLAYIECRGDADEDAVAAILATLTADQFGMAMSTRTAFSLEAARLVCDALTSRAVLPPSLRPAVELALHEIVANAIIHGNLAMDQQFKDDPELFGQFCELLNERLNDTPAGQRWIQITANWTDDWIKVSVIDQGKGFTQKPAATPVDVEKPYGRGLGIAAELASAVTISDGGRRTTLRFDTRDA